MIDSEKVKNEVFGSTEEKTTGLSQERITDIVKVAMGKRTYISDPSEAPEGANVQQGERGGYYIDDTGVGGGGGGEVDSDTSQMMESSEGERFADEVTESLPEFVELGDAEVVFNEILGPYDELFEDELGQDPLTAADQDNPKDVIGQAAAFAAEHQAADDANTAYDEVNMDDYGEELENAFEDVYNQIDEMFAD